jgi:hypothetical protein
LSPKMTLGLKEAWLEGGRHSAVKLVDDLAGESPVSANYPVGTVVISGDGAGDQAVGSPEVNVLVGWVRIRSAPTGGLTKQQVVAKANRSEATKYLPHENRSVRITGMPKLLCQVEGQRLR